MPDQHIPSNYADTLRVSVPELAEIREAEDIFTLCLSTFGKHGFFPRATIVAQNDQTGVSILFRLESPNTGVNMRISYAPSLNINRRHCSVILERKGMDYPIILDQYLAAIGRSDLLPYLVDHGRTVSLPVFWGQLVAMLDELFSNELKDAIAGSQWPGTAFDWDGYK